MTRTCQFIFYVAAFLLLSAASCTVRNTADMPVSSCRYARYFDIISSGDSTAVIVISPGDSSRDTLVVTVPVNNMICMSSSHVAALSQIGADSVISAVSGMKYISSPELRRRAASQDDPVYDIGYEAYLDYERIFQIDPDLIVTYTVSGAEPPYISKLRSMGMNVMILHDHLEDHPLARAEYIRLFGALTGRMPTADSIFNQVCEKYISLIQNVPSRRKVLLNIPYADAWYIPGGESYMSRLVNDAGGEVLGSISGTSESSVITVEKAYLLSLEADVWLNPGTCVTRDQLKSAHHMFPRFGPVVSELPIYNNTLRSTPEGGNDFWESGAMRPDLILEDLINIFNGNEDAPFNYFLSVD